MTTCYGLQVYGGQVALYPSLFLFPLVSIGFGLIVVSAISPQSFLYNLRSKALGLVATLSYSIYLSHKIIFHLAQKGFGELGVPANGFSMICICLGMALGFALFMHYAVEHPAFHLRDRLLAKRFPGRTVALESPPSAAAT